MTRERIDNDLKDAMRARDQRRLLVLRMVRTGIKNAEVAAGRALDESGILGVIQKQFRERQDSIEQFRNAGRTDLVTKEEAELAVLQEYMPEQMDRAAIQAAVREVIAEVGASGPADKGKVMGPLMQRLRGKADGREINAVVTELLAGRAAV